MRKMMVGKAATNRTRGRIASLSLVSLLPALLLSPSLAATTIAKMSIEKMSRVAPVIVRATCVSSHTAWDAGEIWTFTTFDVTEKWRGAVPARITVRLLGGSSGNLTSIVAGVPRFASGEDVVLFLEPTVRGDLSVVAWSQGTFRIARGSQPGSETVTQGTAGFATFNPATRRFEDSAVRRMPLATLHTRVQAALNAAPGAKQ